MENRLRHLRTEATLTQEQLAHRSGVTLRTIQRMERQDGSPSIDTAKALADALGLASIADLFVTDEVPA